MVFTTLKSKFKMKDPTIVTRCYNNFYENSFREELKNNLENIYLELGYENFELIFMTILNLHAPMKKKSSEEIMHPS